MRCTTNLSTGSLYLISTCARDWDIRTALGSRRNCRKRYCPKIRCCHELTRDHLVRLYEPVCRQCSQRGWIHPIRSCESLCRPPVLRLIFNCYSTSCSSHANCNGDRVTVGNRNRRSGICHWTGEVCGEASERTVVHDATAEHVLLFKCIPNANPDRESVATR